MDRRIQKAYDIIKKGYQDKLLLADLAKKVGLSTFFFQRLFKKEMNETPSVCMNRLRLERAAHLLKIDPGISMSQIALDCGFSSLSTFSRAFSQKYGLSPLSFSRVKSNYTSIATAQRELKVEVVYHAGSMVFYSQTSFYNTSLLKDFSSVVSFCELNEIPTSKKMIGILTHVSFHGQEDGLNYYAGVEINSKVVNSVDRFSDRIFIIPKGKYACFSTSTSFHHLFEMMIQFKLEWLDKSPYVIREIFAFEEISPENKHADYPFFKRKVYIPIRHK